MTWRDIDVFQFNRLPDPLVIDVRSPCEHESEYIPGSVNIPLLSNEERAIVGTIYVQQGESLARREALRFISPKIPDIVDDIRLLRAPQQLIIIHCWRGGLRSEAVASFLSVIGIDCFRLTGGYKAWRRHVLEQFAGDRFKFEAVVLQGLTGVGKTDILNELSTLGHCVLDLEKLANHRGSIFGALGLGAQPTQKNFEAQLYLALQNVQNKQVFVEAESRKVGKLSVPSCILASMQVGKRVLVTGSRSGRRDRIMRDYAPNLDEQDQNAGAAYLEKLKPRLGAIRCRQLIELASLKHYAQLVEVLLDEYYDPLYRHAIERDYPYDLEVDGDDPRAAALKISEKYSLAIKIASAHTYSAM